MSMKISEITADNLINYLRLSPEEKDEKEAAEIKTFLETAKEFIYSYTGLSFASLKTHQARSSPKALHWPLPLTGMLSHRHVPGLPPQQGQVFTPILSSW